MDRAGVLQQAAQGEVLHDCDTTMKILDLPLGESRPRKPADDESEAELERTGIFTSGIVSTRAGQGSALFFTGRKHVGEYPAAVLARRAHELGPPFQLGVVSGEYLTGTCIAWLHFERPLIYRGHFAGQRLLEKHFEHLIAALSSKLGIDHDKHVLDDLRRRSHLSGNLLILHAFHDERRNP